MDGARNRHPAAAFARTGAGGNGGDMPQWLQAGLWGLLSASALVIGAMLADTMIPEAFETAHEYAGLITVLGFLAAFALSKLAGG
jgi:hypothetical protein